MFIIDNIPKDKYDVIPIGITKEGIWYIFNGDIKDIENDKWIDDNDNIRVLFCADREHTCVTISNNKPEKINFDVIFPVLHGKNGEDGTIQGLLQLCGLPFVGPDMAASSACMDKIVTNIMLEYENINQAKFEFLYDYDLKDIEKCVTKIKTKIKKYPMFIKPSSAGSSVGVSKAENDDELIKALIKASKEDKKILIEEAIIGRELECAVLGNEDKLIISDVGEIISANDFYDFEAKYANDNSKVCIPAPKIDDKIRKKIRDISKKAYMLLNCSGLSRIDFFLDKDNNIYLNEINTIPGFTSISMYPKLMEHSGLNAKELTDKLITLALDSKR
jgi:D-alanine-D-alanine ligase